MPRFTGTLTIAAVGKLRTRHWLDAQNDYKKRLSRYFKFKLTEVRDVVGRSIPDHVAMQREGEALLKAIKPASRRIALTIDGPSCSSVELAKKVRHWMNIYGHVAFVIGGPVGLSPEVIRDCEEQLSLSPMTFTHEIARVLLLEQLYRAATILNHEQYHK